MQQPARSSFLNPASPPTIGTLMVLTGISAMSMNMFLPSLPSMAAYFETDPKIMQLSVSLFLALNGALQIVIGPMSDRYGRRPVLIIGFLIFRSNFFPKVLGGLFLFAGLGYLIHSLGTFLLPQYDVIYNWVIMATIPAELAFAFWLLIKGVNVEKWEKIALVD